jgi:hypothetical protein
MAPGGSARIRSAETRTHREVLRSRSPVPGWGASPTPARPGSTSGRSREHPWVHGGRPTTRRVRLARGLRSVAVWRNAVMNRGAVGLVVRTAAERRHYVVDGVRSGCPADVADPSVATQDSCAESLPVRWQWRAAVSGHARTMPRRGYASVRLAVISMLHRASDDAEMLFERTQPTPARLRGRGTPSYR